MKIYNLSSGSKANATFIKSKNLNILIDAGTTKKYLNNALNELDHTIDDIDLVLITHFHSDHCKCLNTFDTQIIYSQNDSHQDLILNQDNIFDDIIVRPFQLSHDEPCLGYQIKHNNQVLTYITDTGFIKNDYLDLMNESDYLYLEFNHDIIQLNETHRPAYIKRRILSDTGHLNNKDAAFALVKSKSKLKQLVVAHMLD